MIIGVPKEVKNQERRVGMVPSSVQEAVANGHRVFVETGAGDGIGETDAHYQAAGATILFSAEEVFGIAELVVKVKEPQTAECKMLRPQQVLFTFLHLAPDPVQTRLLQESGCIAIAYETVVDRHGRLPLLSPMSQVAGRLSIQAGARCLEKSQGGSGILLGGIPGVTPAHVTIIGGGVVGQNALRMAIGLGAVVTILDKSLTRLQELDDAFEGRVKGIYSNETSLERAVVDADLVIGAILQPGATASKVITREMLKKMRSGSVVVDVSIDQGGCFETSRPTSHDEPTYVDEAIVHYCVTNMPGAVPRTSTYGLNNATLPYILQLANKGPLTALKEDACFRQGLNIFEGNITCEGVARAQGEPYLAPEAVIR